MPNSQAPSGLLADLYELTMAAGYLETHFEARATFELFVRSLPPKRNFLIAAGLEQALEFLETVRFSSEDIAYLRQHPAFARISADFFDYLAAFRFSGDVWALPEGTVCFPGEPLLCITAPIAEAQIMETALLATISFQTMIASKAARVVKAAAGRPIVEFGSRRAHGTESGVLAARAAYIGGCLGTSNVRAGQLFDIPTYGTQAHSWIMAHDREEEAFAHFMDIFPHHSVLLLDTYDVRAALEKVIAIGRKPRGVRLDSGDLAADSIWVRQKLDEAGWGDVEIFISGDLDEERISRLLDTGARVDTFGVGTSLSTSSDAPSLGVLYKLVEVERGGEVREAAKFSAAKVTYPGRKQIYRETDSRGDYAGDVIALKDERMPGEPLLLPVMRAGKRVSRVAPLAELQKRCQSQIEHLPAAVRALEGSDQAYPVRHSARLETLLEEVRERIARTASRP
ncbi:MAG: nicotinate phosphoribosyltransferase [Acidobacteria bacterium]|nr:MAG: nicotinate phosphoribosyltransferase [Acidobacteriota bacterium]